MLALDIPIYEDALNWVFYPSIVHMVSFIVALVGTRFNKYIAVLKASPHKLM